MTVGRYRIAGMTQELSSFYFELAFALLHCRILPSMKKLSTQLREWQDRNDLKQKDAAKLLGVTRGTFESWLYDKRTPTALTLSALLQKIGAK